MGVETWLDTNSWNHHYPPLLLCNATDIELLRSQGWFFLSWENGGQKGALFPAESAIPTILVVVLRTTVRHFQFGDQCCCDSHFCWWIASCFFFWWCTLTVGLIWWIWCLPLSRTIVLAGQTNLCQSESHSKPFGGLFGWNWTYMLVTHTHIRQLDKSDKPSHQPQPIGPAISGLFERKIAETDRKHHRFDGQMFDQTFDNVELCRRFLKRVILGY